jgi:hypothetical protein
LGTSQPAYKRLWLPFTIGAVLVVAAVILGVLILHRGSDQASPGPGPRVKVPHSSVPQAKWKIKMYPAGSLGKPGKPIRKAVAREKPRLTRIITDVYDALFLVPDRYRQVVTGYFMKPGAGILLHTNLAPPHGAKGVSTKVRRASIGLQADSVARAAARVKVAAKAKDNGKTISWSTVSTLWMEKQSGRWKVVGFDISQAPSSGKRYHKAAKGHHKHKGKN